MIALEGRKISKHAAFTAVELLVSLGIISLLLALLLPAIQGAREAARASQCRSNLRQIALAALNYHEVNACLPPGMLGYRNPGRGYNGYYSIFSRILPYLEQRPLYDGINFAAETYPESAGIPPISRFRAANAINHTIMTRRIGVLLCPTDPETASASGTSYRGNAGVGPNYRMEALYQDSGNGLYPDAQLVTSAQVPDGLSHTVAFSERLLGSGEVDHISSPTRAMFNLSIVVYTADDLLLACSAAARPKLQFWNGAGLSWFWAGRGFTIYNHAQVPDGPVPDCIGFQQLGASGMATARSCHPAGLNAVFGDGSVRTVSDGVDQAVWRGMGTRNGGELVD